MATFEELFPQQDPRLFEPFEPIQPKSRAGPRRAIGDLLGGAGGVGGDTGITSSFDEVLNELRSMEGAEPPGDVEWADYWKTIKGASAGTGAAAAGALEYGAGAAKDLAGALGIDQSIPRDLERGTQRIREDLGGYAQEQMVSMSPEARERIAREVMTLDPDKTLWQGGVDEFASSLALKLTQAAPSTALTLLPGAMMMKAGLRGGGIAYLGASEGGLSMGQIANNIADEIAEAPESELMESPRYAELRKTMGEQDARRALTEEAQGATPLIAGALVGSISALAGRYLEPVFLPDKGLGLTSRFARGFATEGPAQEGPQGSVEQIAQNISAQIYDTGRSTWEGVGEAYGQGTMVGGLMGGGFSAVAGQRPQPPSAGLTGQPGGTPTGEPPVDADIAAAITESQEPKQRPNIDPYSGQMDMFPSGGQWDIEPQPPQGPAPMTPQQEQASYLQRPWPMGQQELDLAGPQPGQFPVPSAPPRQLPLGLRQRQRGGYGEVIEPTPSTLAEPPGLEPRPGDYLPPKRRPTVADFMRARARSEEPGPQPIDPDQLSLFEPPPDEGGGPPPPGGGAPVAGAVGRRTLEGFAVRVRNAAGAVIDEDLYATREEANAAIEQKEADLDLRGGKPLDVFVTAEPVYNTPTQRAGVSPVQDTPSAEPLSDLKAQLADLADPDSPRLGVYLAPANMRRLRAQRAYEQVRGTGVPLANFDGKGGMLIAKDDATAKRLLDMREQGTDMQELLGLATGAGIGKPMGDIVVQLRDDSGNVTRESLVASTEQADALVSRWEEETGQEAIVLSSAAAIRRRGAKISGEAVAATKKRRRGELVTAVESAIPGVLPEEGTPKTLYQARAEQREELVETAMRGAKTPEEAGQNVAREAGRTELRREIYRDEGIDEPNMVDFGTFDLNRRYLKLHNDFLTQRQIEHNAREDGRQGDVLEAKGKGDQAKRRLVAFARLHEAKTVGAEPLARAARQLGVTRANVETRLRGRGPAEELEPFAPLTDEEVRKLSDEDLDVEFVRAAERAAGDRQRRVGLEQKLRTGKTKEKTPEEEAKEKAGEFAARKAEDFEEAARTEEDTARMAEESVTGQVGEASGRTFRELVEAYPTRSQKMLLIRNLSRRMRDRQYGSKRSRPFTRTTTREEAQVGGITVLSEKQINALDARGVNREFRKAIAQYTGRREKGSLTDEPLVKLLRDHPRITDRREYLRRVHGKWREAGETRVPITRAIATRHGKFDPSVLYATEPTKGEMESSEAERGKQRTRHKNAVAKLQTSVSKADATIEKLGGDEAVFARAYLRTIMAYGQALTSAKPQSYKGIEQMEIVAKTLNELSSDTRTKQIASLNAMMQAELQEQTALAVRGNEAMLGALKDPSKRAQITATMIEKKQAQVARLHRIQEIWGNDPYYKSSVAPVLRKIVNLVDAERVGHNPALDYPTEQEMKALRFAVRLLRRRFTDEKTWRQELGEQRRKQKLPEANERQQRFIEARDKDFIALRRALYDAGVRFNDKSDVLIPYNEKGEYEWTNDRVLDAIWRRRFGKSRDAEGAITGGYVRGTSAEEINQMIAESRRKRGEAIDRDLITPEGVERLGLAGTVNDAIRILRDELQGKPTAVQVMATEQRFIDKMKRAGLWKPVGKGGQFGRISLPGVQTSVKAPHVVGKTVEYHTRLVRTPDRQITVRLMGPQLRKGSVTVAAARQQMLELYKPMPVNVQSVPQMIEQLEKLRVKGMTVDQQRLLERLQEIDKERSRPPTPTSFEQVAQDRTMLSTKEERARIRNLPPEQRRLAESLARRDRATKKLRLLDTGLTATQYKEAGQRLAAMLDENVEADLDAVLATMWNNVPSESMSGRLASMIRGLHLTTKVTWEPSEFFQSTDTKADYSAATDTISLNRDFYDELRARGRDPSADIFQTVLHEATHAATHYGIETNAQLRDAILQMANEVRAALKAQGRKLPYGVTAGGNADVIAHEFVAEAFSNPDFQEILRTLPSTEQRSVWQRFVDAVKRIFGITEAQSEQGNMLEAVMDMSDSLFAPPGAPTTGMLRLESRADAAAKYAADVIDRLDQNRKVRNQYEGRVAEAKLSSSSGMLSAMTMEQLRNFFAKHFVKEDGTSALEKYWRAFSKRGADNSASLERADRISRKWTELTEQENGTANAAEVSEIMTMATRHGVHPDLPLVARENQHVQLDRNLSLLHTQLMRRFDAMPEAWRDHYTNVRKYYADTLEKEIDLATLNALRAYVATGTDAAYTNEQFDRRFPEGSVKKMKLNTKAGLRDAFREEHLPDAALDNVYRMARIPSLINGPYFPMTRFGDFGVHARKFKESKVFSNPADARSYRADLMSRDPSLEIHSKKEDDGNWHVTVHEVEFRLAETMTEAKENERLMVELYGRDAVTPVQLRNKFLSNESAISGDQSLRAILDKLGDNDAAKAAIKDFYLRSLGERSFRKHESKRKFTRGVNDQIQHRAFQAYSLAASYYMAQLRYGWKLGEAKREMFDVVKGHRDESEVTSVRMGQILKEIQLRDEMTTNTDTTPNIVRRGVEWSHFMLLASPSYAMINMSQPWLVGLPWLSARYGMVESAAALGSAQKMIASPLLSEAKNSWGGMKALFSKMAGEKAFTVIDQIIDENGSLVQRLGKEGAKPYIDLLRQLRRLGIVDLSLVSEIRAGAEGIDTSATQRVLDASRIMAHLTEVNNRVLMAIATYDLAKSKGADHEMAIEAAGQAVSMTQFNYSAGNKPRLFQSKGPLGKYAPLAFQFMQYPQHLYALMVGEYLKATRSSGVERKQALKTLSGLVLSHLAVGGMIGAMLQPMKWALGMIFAAFSDDDDRWQDIASGETFDRHVRETTADIFGTELGLLASKGIPAALGADLSSRMSLGTLYFIDMKPETAESFLGSLALSFGGPWPGLITGGMRGAQYMMEGEPMRGLEYFMPKGAKDFLRFTRYASDGLTTATGNEIIAAKDMKPMELFLQSMGFTPTRVTEAYDARSAMQTAEDQDDSARTLLIRQFTQADSPEERQDVRDSIREYNRSGPVVPITYGSLLRSRVQSRTRERNTRRYGADLRGRRRRYAEEAEPYTFDVGEEEGEFYAEP